MSSRKNEWTLVTFEDIAQYIESEEIAQITFAKDIGVTNSTFHNWKNSKSVPDEAMQERIAGKIGKKRAKVTKKVAKASKVAKKVGKKVGKKTTKKAGDTLDDLVDTNSKRATRAAKKTGKKPGPKPKATKAKSNKKKTKATKPAAAKPGPKPKVAKKAPVKRGRKPKLKMGANGVHANGTASVSERAYLIGRYMDGNGVRSVDEFGQLIERVTTALV